MKDERERLGKIVQLAKKGIDGEKEVAIRMVKVLCNKLDLNFDDVMKEGDDIREFVIECSKNLHNLLVHVVVKYAHDGDGTITIWGRLDEKNVKFETTEVKYLETVHAFTILSRLYKKEQKRVEKAMWFGFLERHDLFAKKVHDQHKEPSEEEMKERQMGQDIARGMEEAKLHKTLTGGSQ